MSTTVLSISQVRRRCFVKILVIRNCCIISTDFIVYTALYFFLPTTA